MTVSLEGIEIHLAHPDETNDELVRFVQQKLHLDATAQPSHPSNAVSPD